MDTMKSLDKNALVQLYKLGGKEFLFKMIDSFLENAPKKVETAKKASETGDLSAIHLAVHSLRASAANFGAAKVHELAEKLEEFSIKGNPEPIPELIEQLHQALGDTLQSLRTEKEGWKD